MKTINFIQMKDGSKEEYLLLDKNKDYKYFTDVINFCEKLDQASFDLNFKTKSLEFFAPIVKIIFARKPYSFI